MNNHGITVKEVFGSVFIGFVKYKEKEREVHPNSKFTSLLRFLLSLALSLHCLTLKLSPLPNFTTLSHTAVTSLSLSWSNTKNG